MDDQTLTIARKVQNWTCRPTIDPLGILSRILSDVYHDRKYLQDGEPSGVFWFDQSMCCYDERWSVPAVPWKGSKGNRGWQCATWLPEKAGKALHTAIMMTMKDRQARETVLFLDTMGIMFENHFLIVSTKINEVMAIMRQRPFQQGPDQKMKA